MTKEIENFVKEIVQEELNKKKVVNIVVEDGGVVPTKATEDAAAYDIYAADDVDIAFERFNVPLNIRFALPKGYAAIIKPRSGLTMKGMEIVDLYGATRNIDCDTKDGVIDSDYRGIVKVMMRAHNKHVVRNTIKKGTRIAQMLVVKVEDIEWNIVEHLDETDRASGAFGHTGTH